MPTTIPQPSKNRTRCTFRLLDNGIYEFTMTESSRLAVDELFDIMGELSEQGILKGGATLLDSSAGIQPLNYIFARFRAFIKDYPMPPNTATKLAMLIPMNPLIQALDMMMRAFPFLKTRIFRPDQRAAAEQWLLE